jgi:hypothetical protein
VEGARIYVYRLRSILRHRWTDYLTLTLLVAALGGLAMGSVVVGRRTQSSFTAFLGRDNASTLTVSTYGVLGSSTANAYSPAIEEDIRRLPGVESVEAWVGTFAVPIASDGSPRQDINGLNIAGSVDGIFFHQDRAVVVRGRMADPDSPGEFVISALGARLLGLRLGQEVPFGVFTEKETEEPAFGTAAVQPVSRIQIRLVGIVEFNDEVIQDDTDRTPTNLVLTPALTRRLGDSYGTWFGIRLRPGVRDIGQVESSIVAVLPPGSAPNFNLQSAVEDRVETSLRPESIAIGGFGLIAALAALGICIPVLSRLTLSGEQERRVLRALGADPTTVAADTWIGAVTALVVGTLLAVLVSAVLSSVAPLGPVHRLYHPGSLSIDWTVVGTGAALFSGVLGAIAVTMAVRRARRSSGRDGQDPPPSVSRAAVAAAAAGLPVPVVIGTRFALEPGRGRTAVPARSVIGGATLSVAIVVATLTFGSGLHTLVSRPALYGWNWSYAVISQNVVPPQAQAALTSDPLVQAWSGYSDINLEVDGRVVPALGAAGGTAVGPPILAGHEVTGADQVVLGRSTLAALGKRVGDVVQVGYGSPSTAPLYLPPRPMTIVGTATFPAIAASGNFAEHTSMGVGALMSYLSLPASFHSQIQSPDPTQDGPTLAFVRYRSGISDKAATADLNRILGVAAAAFASDPSTAGDYDSYIGVQRPAAIVNYQSSGGTPLVLAASLALGAMVALASSLVASVRRRRRDLAVLKTLGFTRAQTTATVAAQALLIAAIADAIGIPVGIAAGRQLWIAFARSIDAVPEPSVPASVALVGILTLVIALAVAVLPGRLAARTPVATVLRAE